MSNIFSKLNLQNPFWQGVGAIVSIIALIVSSYTAYDIYQKSVQFSEVTILEGYSFNPIDFGEDANIRISMIVNGEQVSDVQVFQYRLKNTGKAPILPEHFVEPIRISTQKPSKILAIEKYWSYPKELSVNWKKLNNTSFQLKPLLLNPGDYFTFLVFISSESTAPLKSDAKKDTKININNRVSNNSTNGDAASEQSAREQPKPSWAGRIVNVSMLKILNQRQASEEQSKSLGGLLNIRFYHSGWGVYRFAAFALMLFVFGLVCGAKFGVLQKGSMSYYILLCMLMGFSVTSGETLAARIDSSQPEHWISNLALILYGLLIVFFTFPAIRSLFRNKP